MKTIVIVVMLGICAVLLPIKSFAAYENCKKFGLDNYENGHPYQTKFGVLEVYQCPEDAHGKSPAYLVLGGKTVFRESYSIGLREHSRDRDIYIYVGGENRTSLLGPCTGTQYLLDLRGKRPRMMNFGIKNACNQIDDVVWKKDRVLINFNRDAKFQYVLSTGEMMLPKDDPLFYDPVFDENSPVIDAYTSSGDRHKSYKLAPPYVSEIILNW